MPALGWARSSVPSRELPALLPSAFSQPSRGLWVPEEDAIVCGLKSRCGARGKMRFSCSGTEIALRGSGQGSPRGAARPAPAARRGRSRAGGCGSCSGASAGSVWESFGNRFKAFPPVRRESAGNHRLPAGGQSVTPRPRGDGRARGGLRAGSPRGLPGFHGPSLPQPC